MKHQSIISVLVLALILAACQPAQPAPSGDHLLASVSFLADIAQHVAGDQFTVESLVPLGVDPHSYTPTPQDAARLEDSQVLIINGGEYESFLTALLEGAGGERLIITASDGLPARTAKPGEPSDPAESIDPHFWLDPTLVITYVENIRAGLTHRDPDHAQEYQANADDYIAQLNELDAWIQEQINTIPPENRVLVTNHESLGYYADRYGLRVAGAIIGSVSTESSPSARQLIELVQAVKASGAKAVFIEAGANQQLADQLAAETGIPVAPPLYLESLTGADGPAPSYIAMMRATTSIIVAALR